VFKAVVDDVPVNNKGPPVEVRLMDPALAKVPKEPMRASTPAVALWRA